MHGRDAPELSEGLNLLERYTIIDHIGGGGMATIYRAHDSRLDRIVCVKLLRNVIETKFERIMRPIAERILDPGQVALTSADAFFQQTLFHELSHSLGPAFATVICLSKLCRSPRNRTENRRRVVWRC